MGAVIAVIGPAMLSMKIKINRNGIGNQSWYVFFVYYILEILKNTFLTVATITYLFRIDDVQFSAMNSFPFFSKYIIISIVYAFLLPYIEEIIRKYIKVTFGVENKHHEEREKIN